MKLADEAKKNGVELPSDRTLKIYGLKASDWLRILKRQKWACPLCGVTGKVLWNIDHEHVAGWSKMSDADRAKHVRGILCFRCNRYNAPSRNFTTNMAKKLHTYIQKYEKRRDRE